LYAVQARRQSVPRTLPSGEHVLPAARAAASLASSSSSNQLDGIESKGKSSDISNSNNHGSGWSAIQDFITGPDPAAPLSKDQFYQRLATCPEAQLPQVQQLVTVTFTEEAIPSFSPPSLEPSSSLLPALQLPAPSEGLEDEFSDAQSGITPREGSRGRSHDKEQLDEFYDASDTVADVASSGAQSDQTGQSSGELHKSHDSNSSSSTMSSSASQPRVQVDEFLVVAALGGGAVREMAVDPAHRSMKFIPWGGVAAHLRRDGIATTLSLPLSSSLSTAVAAAGNSSADGDHGSKSSTDQQQRQQHQDLSSHSRGFFPVKQRSGKAFCFLPLPVDTQLPVHVNGYFELSSNRRDIWFGQDMSGDGARRSEWNKVKAIGAHFF